MLVSIPCSVSWAGWLAMVDPLPKWLSHMAGGSGCQMGARWGSYWRPQFVLLLISLWVLGLGFLTVRALDLKSKSLRDRKWKLPVSQDWHLEVVIESLPIVFIGQKCHRACPDSGGDIDYTFAWKSDRDCAIKLVSPSADYIKNFGGRMV